jgi:hypothetical protein
MARLVGGLWDAADTMWSANDLPQAGNVSNQFEFLLPDPKQPLSMVQKHGAKINFATGAI